jgi:toxin secretion/phage lysis holin
MEFLKNLLNSTSLQILCVVIVLDLIFGVLRAIKEKSVNSCIGIDGMIRKVGMLITIIVLTFIDSLVHIDFIGFIPEQAKEILHFSQVGIADVFNVLFVIFEVLSIFKNMILIKMPIPKKLQNYLEKIMKEFTGEIKEESEEK